jgi:hypothetical protein
MMNGRRHRLERWPPDEPVAPLRWTRVVAAAVLCFFAGSFLSAIGDTADQFWASGIALVLFAVLIFRIDYVDRRPRWER